MSPLIIGLSYIYDPLVAGNLPTKIRLLHDTCWASHSNQIHPQYTHARIYMYPTYIHTCVHICVCVHLRTSKHVYVCMHVEEATYLEVVMLHERSTPMAGYMRVGCAHVNDGLNMSSYLDNR
jgi:hypothetical protein